MGNIYLITGCTSDIGTALVRRILHPEDQVIALGHNDLDKLNSLRASFPDAIHAYDVDLSNGEQIEQFIDHACKAHPMPTHIVHLPALPVINTKFKNFDEDRFILDMNIQVMSAVKLCRAFLPKMAKAHFGRVLFMQTSYTIGCPPKNTAAYVIAKSCIGGLVKSLAVEYAQYGITVNCIAPSMIETHFLADTPDLIVQASAADNPMGRNARVEDVVPAMAFLLSDDARFITGITLPITGGSTIG